MFKDPDTNTHAKMLGLNYIAYTYGKPCPILEDDAFQPLNLNDAIFTLREGVPNILDYIIEAAYRMVLLNPDDQEAYIKPFKNTEFYVFFEYAQSTTEYKNALKANTFDHNFLRKNLKDLREIRGRFGMPPWRVDFAYSSPGLLKNIPSTNYPHLIRSPQWIQKHGYHNYFRGRNFCFERLNFFNSANQIPLQICVNQLYTFIPFFQSYATQNSFYGTVDEHKGNRIFRQIFEKMFNLNPEVFQEGVPQGYKSFYDLLKMIYFRPYYLDKLVSPTKGKEKNLFCDTTILGGKCLNGLSHYAIASDIYIQDYPLWIADEKILEFLKLPQNSDTLLKLPPYLPSPTTYSEE